jgi:hypothetical protein
VALYLGSDRDCATLTIQDDGVGAASAVLRTAVGAATHFGLRDLHARLEHVGGTFVAGPGDDGGFVVHARAAGGWRVKGEHPGAGAYVQEALVSAEANKDLFRRFVDGLNQDNSVPFDDLFALDCKPRDTSTSTSCQSQKH